MLAIAFVAGTALAIAASATLVRGLERLGARIGLTEATLGLLAALAADTPEITSSATAMAHHQHDVGIGVVFGSNVFNLAALLGLGAVVAGRVSLHRRVVVLEGAVALWLAAVSLTTSGGLVAPPIGLVLAVVGFLPYVAISAVTPKRRGKLPLPQSWRRWLVGAVREEEEELEPAVHLSRGGLWDAAVAAVSLAVVVGASILMEQSATAAGTRYSISPILVGGVVLAAVTSLPNLVAAIYLGRRGRSAAMLSEAMNSNAINSIAGFFIPATVIGLAHPSSSGLFVVAWYGALTAAILLWAYVRRGLHRPIGAVVVVAYAVFVVMMAVK